MPVSPRTAVYAAAGLIGLALAYGLMQMPIQASDSLAQLLSVQQSPSPYATFVDTAGRGAYLRPMFITVVHLLFDLADGHYWLVFRGFHALLIIAALFLFVRALEVETPTDRAAAIFALTVFTGLATFRGLVREAFPVNHFLTIVVLCLAALNLARSKGGWWIDAAAVAAFVVASLTIESGLLVWVVLATAWATGMRGVSRRGMIAVTVLFGAYFWVRFGVLSTGTPSLLQRSSGFLVDVLEPAQIQERFGTDPIWYYVYNVSTSTLSVLFTDPDGGVFEIARAWLRGDVPPRLYLAVTSSVMATATIAWSIASRVRRAPRATPAPDNQLLVIAAAVLVANSVMSYAYTKHEIISVAGAFYAIAAYVAARHALHRVALAPGRFASTIGVVCLAMTASLWAIRSAGVHHMLREQGFKARFDWAYVVMPPGTSPESREQAALIRQLRADAFAMRVTNPYTLPRWMDRWWGE